MNGKWVEVFRAGKKTDSAGAERTWTEGDLDAMVARYDPAKHEAPVVVGHPTQNAPAYGWVEGLKRDGKVLLARLKGVMPEFADLVQQGTYKKRSISLYPDLTLRHIGFLGGAAPAVKGLADIAFAERDSVTVETGIRDQGPVTAFTDPRSLAPDFTEEDRVTLGFFQRLKNWIIGKDGPDVADGIFPEYDLEALRMEIVKDALEEQPVETLNRGFVELDKRFNDSTIPQFTKEDDPMQIAELNQKLAEFTERIRQQDETIATLKMKINEEREAVVRKEFTEFLATPEMQQRIPEGSREATLNHLVLLSRAPDLEFTEADGTTRTVAPVAQYREELRALPTVVEFKETATKDNAAKTADGPQLVTDYMAQHVGTTYKQALLIVSKAHPELFKQ